MLACFHLFTSFLCFITNALPDTIFLGHLWVFVTNLAFFIRIPDNLHKSIMITLYYLANIQNKAQKVWEWFEKRQWRKFRFRHRYRNLILEVSVIYYFTCLMGKNARIFFCVALPWEKKYALCNTALQICSSITYAA